MKVTMKNKVSATAISLGNPHSLFPQSYATIPHGNRARYINFHRELNKASVEEDVKAAYRTFFSLPQDSSQHQDLYTQKILFEFKYDKNFKSKHVKAEVLAQILYYVHRLKFDIDTKPIPPYLSLADVNEVPYLHEFEIEMCTEETYFAFTLCPYGWIERTSMVSQSYQSPVATAD